MTNIRFITLTICFFLFHSCATFRTGDIDSEFNFDNHEENSLKHNTSIELVSYDYIENGVESRDWVTEKKKLRVSGVIIDAFKQTQLFNVNPRNPKNNNQFKIDVSVRRNLSYSKNMRWITPLTLYLIPRSVSETIVVTSKFLNPKGKLIGMTEFSDELVTWHQMFMILGLPFTGTTNNQVMTSIEELVKSSVEQALEDGYFNSF